MEPFQGKELTLLKNLFPRNDVLIDYFIERTLNNGDLNSTVVLFRNTTLPWIKEEIHPFSINNVLIYTDSIEEAARQKPIQFKVSEIRRPNIVRDSEQAVDLLGDVIEKPDSIEDFIYRTSRELNDIDKRRRVLAGMGIDADLYSLEYLERLEADLTVDRLLAIDIAGETPPGFNISLTTYKDKLTGNVDFEIATLNLPNGADIAYTITGNKMSKRLAEKFELLVNYPICEVPRNQGILPTNE
jgi:hypothetical protein